MQMDSYLESLVFIAKYYQKTVSRDSLVSGILAQDKTMDIEGFKKSAIRIGLIPKLIVKELTEVNPLTLPTVLCLNDGSTCVLLDIDIESYKARVIFPDSEHENVLEIDKLEKVYSKKMILIKNKYRFKNRLYNIINIEKPDRWFWDTMKKNKDIYIKVAIAAVFINLFVIATPLFTMNVYDRVLPNNALATLWVLAAGIFIVILFDLIMKLIRSHYLGIANKKADIIMSNLIFDQLLNIKLDQKPASTGMFLSRLQSFESVREFFSTATIAALVDLPFIIIFISLIFYLGGPMGWISLGTVIIATAFSWYMQKPIKSVIEKSTKEEQIKLTVLNESVTGLEIIKSVRGQNRMKTQYEDSLNQTSYYSEKSQHLSQFVTYFTAFLTQISNVAIVITGVYLASDDSITMGAIIAAMMLNGRVLAPVSQIVSMITRYDRTVLAYNNINELMSMEVERDDKVYLSRPGLKGDIVFKNVTFMYKNQNLPAVENINLQINEGEKVAILGKIGSGKSTLSKLLMNLYSPTSGSVSIDNTDVRQIDTVDLRRAIGYVPQEPFLFLGSVKDNITIGENFVDDEDLIEAAKIAGVTKFIGKHEAGYDLLLGERGDGLSGGERQSITLARALISKPNLLIMDEPTNSMDIQTEQEFIKNMKTITNKQTLILLTHKMSVLELVDRLIVLHDGKIVADGPKDKVLKSLKGNTNE
jgi:ATP-binding cassette subfamily C protein LapB